MRASTARRASVLAALLVAIGALLNAFAYTLVVANPLVRSDEWRMLDGFLGRYIDSGFAWADLFVEPFASDTNFPLYKLSLLANVRWFDLDFRIEAIVGMLAAAVSVLMIAAFPARHDDRDWSASDAWLAAIIACVWLSLNAWGNYTWPLALAWHIPLMLSIAYFCLSWRARWPTLLIATTVLGILQDEFAYPAVIAVFIARAVLARPRQSASIRLAMAMGGGIALSRLFYAIWEWASPAPPGGADAVISMTRSFAGLFSADAWKAVVIPLSDSVLHAENAAFLIGGGSGPAGLVIAVALVAAHAWFWWRTFAIAKGRIGDAAAYLAAAIMLFAYAMVASLLLQRVSLYGYDYLHQPRYVMFYQLNIVALALLAFRDRASVSASRRLAVPVVIVAFVALQFALSFLAWRRAGDISRYTERLAVEIGEVAAAPEAERTCDAMIRVCTFPLEQRRRIMNRLACGQLNVFSSKFQALHRLYPRQDTTATPCHR